MAQVLSLVRGRLGEEGRHHARGLEGLADVVGELGWRLLAPLLPAAPGHLHVDVSAAELVQHLGEAPLAGILAFRSPDPKCLGVLWIGVTTYGERDDRLKEGVKVVPEGRPLPLPAALPTWQLEPSQQRLFSETTLTSVAAHPLLGLVSVRFPLLVGQGGEHVVSPGAVDAKVVAGVALRDKLEAAQEGATAHVLGAVVGLDSV